MNVLHINQSDIGGGAAIAGYRLHKGLLKQGINSKLLVGSAESDDSMVSVTPRRYRMENQLRRLTQPLGFNHLNYIGSFDIPKHPFFQQSDILNFHNLHFSGFSYLSIPRLTKQKPAVFTLHDMWSFTGHCAYSYDCTRWQTGCGSCPYPDTYPQIRRDTTKWVWNLKDWVYSQSNMAVVAPSKWLADQARASMLGKWFPIHHIPYSIDTEAYQPLDCETCRTALGIPSEKNVLLFSAVNLKDSRKGGDLLLQVLQSLPEPIKRNSILLTIGKQNEQLSTNVDIKSIHLGYVNSDRLKAIAYSAADLFIFPTRADNLPLVLQESMACGTPMVSFDVGGVGDLVRHKDTGYLARSEDVSEFRHGIVELLEDADLRFAMKKRCREVALAEYSTGLQEKSYLSIYEKLLSALK